MYGKRKKRAKHLSGGDVHFVKTTVTPPPWLALPLIEQKYHFVQLLSVRLKTASTYFDKVSFFHGCHTPVSACGVPRRCVRPLFWGVSRNTYTNATFYHKMVSPPIRGRE